MQRDAKQVFRFIPGERVSHIVGAPGPDIDDCEILEDNGEELVKIRFQTYGQGPFYEQWRPRKVIVWSRQSETHQRYLQWQEAIDAA